MDSSHYFLRNCVIFFGIFDILFFYVSVASFSVKCPFLLMTLDCTNFTSGSKKYPLSSLESWSRSFRRRCGLTTNRPNASLAEITSTQFLLKLWDQTTMPPITKQCPPHHHTPCNHSTENIEFNFRKERLHNVVEGYGDRINPLLSYSAYYWDIFSKHLYTFCDVR